MPFHPRVTIGALSMFGLLAATSAGAEDTFSAKFSGFGTAGAVRTNTDQAQYRGSPRQDDKGASRSTDFGVDTRLGLQLNLTLTSKLSAVAQALASRRDGKETAQAEWLYAQYAPTDWASLRVGRMVLPVFMLSDTRNVGYAAHWIHAPHEVYDPYPLTSFDGVQAVFRTQWNGINLTAQPSLGRTRGNFFVDLPGEDPQLRIPRLRALSLAAESGDWTVRYGTAIGLGAELKTDIFQPIPPTRDRYSGIGVQYDNGSVLFLAEYATRRESFAAFDSNAYYLSGGYRFGSVLPYVTYSKFTPKGYIYANAPADTTSSVGVRWDAFKGIALKAQYESSTPGLQFARTSPQLITSNAKVKVYSLAVDFVF